MELFKKSSLGGAVFRGAAGIGGGIAAAAYVNRKSNAFLQQKLRQSPTARHIGVLEGQLSDLAQHGMTDGPMWKATMEQYNHLTQKYQSDSERVRKLTYGLGVASGIGTAVLASKLLRPFVR